MPLLPYRFSIRLLDCTAGMKLSYSVERGERSGLALYVVPDHSGVCTHASAYNTNLKIVKLREREGQRVDSVRSLKGHLWMVDGGIPFPDALH